MVACDLVIASDRATFGTTEINVGLWPMMITAEIARNIGRKRTLELMMTGERIDAAEAERIGLINRAVPAAELEDAAIALATRLASRSPSAMRLGLRAFYATQDMPLRPALEALEKQLAAVLATEDAHEGLTAFFEKRAPVWKGR
jgi:enoyl-CoA hydratase/carnithine racemase